jgi:hypothetical protein
LYLWHDRSDLRRTQNVIQGGGIPLVYVEKVDATDQGEVDGMRLLVRKEFAGDSHMAVSKVWADVLGNLGLNALPFCQVEYRV